MPFEDSVSWFYLFVRTGSLKGCSVSRLELATFSAAEGDLRLFRLSLESFQLLGEDDHFLTNKVLSTVTIDFQPFPRFHQSRL